LEEKVKKYVGIMALIILVNGFINAQNQMPGGIIYGNDWAYLVTAPDGWIMDSESLSHYNIYALFYEDGKTFGGKTPIIYINVTGLNNDTDEEMIKYIDWDLGNNIKQGAKVTKLNDQFKEISDIYFIYNIENSRGQFETIIYRRYKNTCFSIILNAPDENTRKQLFQKMVDIINGMKFMDKE
jgi:hypothetical protein